jgi:hypothetical protein
MPPRHRTTRLATGKQHKLPNWLNYQQYLVTYTTHRPAEINNDYNHHILLGHGRIGSRRPVSALYTPGEHAKTRKNTENHMELNKSPSQRFLPSPRPIAIDSPSKITLGPCLPPPPNMYPWHQTTQARKSEPTHFFFIFFFTLGANENSCATFHFNTLFLKNINIYSNFQHLKVIFSILDSFFKPVRMATLPRLNSTSIIFIFKKHVFIYETFYVHTIDVSRTNLQSNILEHFFFFF